MMCQFNIESDYFFLLVAEAGFQDLSPGLIRNLMVAPLPSATT